MASKKKLKRKLRRLEAVAAVRLTTLHRMSDRLADQSKQIIQQRESIGHLTTALMRHIFR